MIILIWLVVWNMAFLTFHSVGNNHPNWRSHIFQGGWNHQPAIMWVKQRHLHHPPVISIFYRWYIYIYKPLPVMGWFSIVLSTWILLYPLDPRQIASWVLVPLERAFIVRPRNPSPIIKPQNQAMVHWVQWPFSGDFPVRKLCWSFGQKVCQF